MSQVTPHVVRAATRWSLLMLAAAAAGPSIVGVRRGHGGAAVGLLLSTTVAAAGLAYAIDDEAADTLAGSPTPLLARRVMRVVVAAVAVAGGWGVAAVAVWVSDQPAPPGRLLAALAVASSGAGLAVASVLARRGQPEASMVGIVGGVGFIIGTTIAKVRFHQLPSMVDVTSWRRWLVVGAVAWAVAVWSSRDPCRPGLRGLVSEMRPPFARARRG